MTSCTRSTTLRVNTISLAPDGPAFSFALHAGECLALLMLNDSGQALRALSDILSGHRPVGSGHLTLLDQDISHRPVGQRGLAVVGARDPLFEHLSIRQNLAFPLRARKLSQDQAAHKIAQLLALLGLEQQADAPPSALTASERLRAQLARALATDPATLILEDIFAGLDSETRTDIHHRLIRLQRARETSLLLLTRDRSDALAAATCIGVIADDALLQIGSAAELIDRPASARLASAMTDANILTGLALTVEDDIVETRLACGGTMEALAEGDVAEGDLVELCIRPGKIALMFPRGAANTDGEAGSLSATLSDIRNVGDLLLLRVRLADSTEMVVHRPAGSLPPGTAVGQTVLLAWGPSAAVVFPSQDKEG
ncbi:ABC transporter ATP-binding protein [Acetobacter sp.]|jgi:putative spermidine/putrescine transport system ATP-binding protein|uniref:ABC transporter ATP-binding protein n=1 Tax=Acetobacter sp. TaxID=440 RepID=UPI0025BC2A2C|nr:ABC transporter ATP-binding protein [Acetobacter sp.]MCH4092165.1 ABC transporter ATP-binding protein [Acetobacter sp.]MCI1299918.1 ABC transporter ATP-binding protein [Acetobacter sp.]MCI1315936.1 ABC transporter ATP-binding protein [Acetobacter sp.]